MHEVKPPVELTPLQEANKKVEEANLELAEIQRQAKVLVFWKI